MSSVLQHICLCKTQLDALLHFHIILHCVVLYFHFSSASVSYNSSESDKAQSLSVSQENGEENVRHSNPKLDNKISETLDTMTRLDTALMENSIDPPIDGGDKMKAMVEEYNKACSDLVILCKKDKLRVLNAASDMLEPGGPKFLDVEINKGEAMANFKWNDENVNEFLELTKKTYSCWKKLWSLYNNFP